MTKLQSLFTQARRGLGGGMGFLSQGSPNAKAHKAALVVRFSQVTAGNTEKMIKAGADGLLFTWQTGDDSQAEPIQQEIASLKSRKGQIVIGAQVDSQVNLETLEKIQKLGIHYVILPFDAPAHLLTHEITDLEKVVNVPFRGADIPYLNFLRSLTMFQQVSAINLNFTFAGAPADLTIEQALGYRSIRETLRLPALITVPEEASETDLYALMAIGVQGVILDAGSDSEKTSSQVKHIRTILENLKLEEDKEASEQSR